VSKGARDAAPVKVGLGALGLNEREPARNASRNGRAPFLLTQRGPNGFLLCRQRREQWLNMLAG
jgi:hypothetical protein